MPSPVREGYLYLLKFAEYAVGELWVSFFRFKSGGTKLSIFSYGNVLLRPLDCTQGFPWKLGQCDVKRVIGFCTSVAQVGFRFHPN